jgi:hypothetical protein
MPQVDGATFLPVILSLVKGCVICYSILFVYLFYPFVSSIKIVYNFFSKIQVLKNILISSI